MRGGGVKFKEEGGPEKEVEGSQTCYSNNLWRPLLDSSAGNTENETSCI